MARNFILSLLQASLIFALPYQAQQSRDNEDDIQHPNGAERAVAFSQPTRFISTLSPPTNADDFDTTTVVYYTETEYVTCLDSTSAGFATAKPTSLVPSDESRLSVAPVQTAQSSKSQDISVRPTSSHSSLPLASSSNTNKPALTSASSSPSTVSVVSVSTKVNTSVQTMQTSQSPSVNSKTTTSHFVITSIKEITATVSSVSTTMHSGEGTVSPSLQSRLTSGKSSVAATLVSSKPQPPPSSALSSSLAATSISSKPQPPSLSASPSSLAATLVSSKPLSSSKPAPPLTSSSIRPVITQSVNSSSISVPVPSSLATIITIATTRPSTLSTIIESTVTTTVVTISTRNVTTTLMETLSTSQLQSVTTTPTQSQSSSIVTTISSIGSTSAQPFNTTVIPSPSTSVRPITSGSQMISTSTTVSPTAPLSNNIFVAIATNAPPPQMPTRTDYPIYPSSLSGGGSLAPAGSTVQTNKFYANFFLGSQNASTWTHPYSVSRFYDTNIGTQGLAISHVEASQRVFASSSNGNPPEYYINPLGIESVIVSAAEVGLYGNMTLDTPTAFSINVNFAPTAGSPVVLTFPLVQGMGFTTGIYQNGTPQLSTTVFFSGLVFGGFVPGTNTVRYQASLLDGTTWLIYLTPNAGHSIPTLTLLSSEKIVANVKFSGILQVAKNPTTSSLVTSSGNIATYDASAGVYPVSAVVSATVAGQVGQYTLTWAKGGVVGRQLLMFALPHHVESLSTQTAAGLKTSLQLQTTTKGIATAVVADSWTLVEAQLPTTMGFAPWNVTTRQSMPITNPTALQLISSVAASELGQDFNAQTNVNSMYYAGKALAKFAFTIYAAADISNSTGIASAGLVKLKQSFSQFSNNTQQNPLVYDAVFGGLVSSAGYTNPGADFGNTMYNDHHFHYGYFVYAASVIAYLDPSWLNQTVAVSPSTPTGPSLSGESTNMDYVNALIRDYANSASNDPYFPFSRMFDWYHGHSWAHGLYETFDGKDEESSSEDAFSSYALKMWGRVTGDINLEARGNLMLSVTARSLRNYFLMETSNTVQPSQFIPNKADGIMFENKVDHTTYFGTNIEYIEGIHMLPLNPSSALTRDKIFVQQEWDTYFSNGRVDQVAGGWRGILYANYALINPRSAWEFFSSDGFQNEWLDGGASRTWYLAFCAGLGGV